MRRIRKAGTLLIILFSNRNANGYMGKSTPSAPAAPDPAATASAQTASNQATALYNFGLANPNITSPLGSNQFSVDTSNPEAPTVQQKITLSPEQQQLYNQNTQQSIGLSNLAGSLQDKVGAAMNVPSATSADFNTASQQAQDAYYKNQTQFLDPQFAQGQEQLDAKLANQGITMGSEAYNNDQNNFARQKQSAYDTAQQNAILQGPQNAQQLFSLSSAAQMQPLNAFNALRSQSQATLPTFGQANQVAAAPTNTAAITQQAYQNSLNPYNAQIAANNQTTGGLFGLGGSLGAAAIMASDIRLKENIRYAGQEKGHAIYHFSYISDPQKLMYRGVMAQEVLNYRPDAVIENGEYYMVDYSKLGIEFARVH